MLRKKRWSSLSLSWVGSQASQGERQRWGHWQEEVSAADRHGNVLGEGSETSPSPVPWAGEASRRKGIQIVGEEDYRQRD